MMVSRTKARAKGDRRWVVLAALPLATGAALIVHVLTEISLDLALAAAATIVAATGWTLWHALTPLQRAELLLRLRVGLLAGVPAALTYDATRWVTIHVFHDTFSPFDVMPLFGRAIAGTSLATAPATALGWAYHYTNGLSFAVAYAVLLAPRRWWLGVFWALGLEAVMLTIYPGWLHPHPFDEFLRVSILGHVAYGSVLGAVSGWAYRRTRRTALLHAKRQPAAPVPRA